MPEKLFIIDAYAHIFRSYYAIRNLSNNAVYGFTRILMRLAGEHKPDAIVAVFDSKGPTFRHEMFPEYKANRAKMPDDLREQIPLIHDMVDAFNIPKLEKPGLEADDLIASCARRGAEAGYDVYIITSDKDLFQLVNDRVRILDPAKEDRVLDAEGVRDVFGVYPDKVAQVLALMGDSSDNIPGAKGIGPKTAIQLIEAYGDIDGIYANLDEIKGKKRENLAESRENVDLSLQLVQLDPDMEVELDLDACAYEEPDTNQLAALFRKLNFASLLKELGEPEAPVVQKRYRMIDSETELAAVLEQLSQQPVVAFDFETADLDTISPRIAGISFAWKPDEAVYLPFLSEDKPVLPEADTLAQLKPIFENPDIGKTGHNLKYDIAILQARGIQIAGDIHDSMIQSYLLDAGQRQHSLDALAASLLGHQTISYETVTGGLPFTSLKAENAYTYACEDADIALQLAERFEPEMEREGVLDVYRDVEAPLIPILADVERTGVSVDRDFLAQLSREFSEKLDGLEDRIYRIAGTEFNINSPKQLGTVLFEVLKLPVIRKTKKTKSYSTSHDVLEELAQHHDIARHIVDFRMFAKLKSTYVDALPELIHPDTGRIHTSYNQAVAATGRLSSSNPNLQNIPIRSAEGQRIREAFVAPAGHLLLAADYSQVELRVLAHLSGDETLKQAFVDGEDIHRRTASELFGLDPEQVTDDLRAKAKAINFGVVYGKREFSLARELDITVGEAREFIDHYFERMPAVQSFIEKTIEDTRATGCVRTLFGRKRPIPDINSKNGNLRQAAERMAVNTPIQGTAADIIKLAMIRTHDALQSSGLDAKMIMQVHDELVFEVAEHHVAQLTELVNHHMTTVLDMDVPLVVNTAVAANWAEAK